MRRLFLICGLVIGGCSDSESTNGMPQGNAGSMNVPDSGAAGGGAGGEGGEAGAGGQMDPGPPPPGDTCDDAVDVNEVGTTEADGTLVVAGTNVAARTDLEVCNDLGPATEQAEVVYRYTAAKTGGLRWSLTDTGLTRFSVDVRTSCEDATSMVACEQCGVDCTTDIEVSEGDALYFVVSGIPTTNNHQGTGSFELSLRLTPDPEIGGPCISPNAGGRECPEGSVCQQPVDGEPVCGASVCGDGFLEFSALMCDDGNMDSGDGCSSTCELDAQGPGSPGCDDPVTLNLPRLRGILDDSISYYGGGTGDFVAGSDLDASCSTAAGPEAVYVFELPVTSDVQITASNVEVLSVRRAEVASCGSEELDCVAGAPTTALELNFPALEPGRYAVLLDSEEPTAMAGPTYVVDVFAEPVP